MNHFLRRAAQLLFALLIAFFPIYCLFERPMRVWRPAEEAAPPLVIRETVDLEGETRILDYPIETYPDLAALAAASDRILVGDCGRDGRFTPSEALKGHSGSAFTIDFSTGLTIQTEVQEPGGPVTLTMEVPSPLGVLPATAVHTPYLVFLRQTADGSYVPAGEPWLAQVYTDHLGFCRLIGKDGTASVTAEAATDGYVYRRTVCFDGLTPLSVQSFPGTLTLEDVRAAIDN